MRKYVFIFLTFISMNVFGQVKVKENSFKKIDGYVMMDKYEHTDINDAPMALIKISTENINAEQRRKFIFKGNLATYFDVRFEPGEIYLYISASAATFLEIIHDDYGKTEYWFPETLCDYCGYEMVIQYVPLSSIQEQVKPQNNFVSVVSDQDDASIYIDDEYIGEKEGFKSFPIGTTHTWRIECDLYHTEIGTIEVTTGDNIIERKMRPAHGFIKVDTKPEDGAIVFINNKKVGVSPYTSDKLASGTYNVKVMKELFKASEQSYIVNDGQTTNATLDMMPNFVNVTINTDSQSDIYVDEEFKAKGFWNGRLYDGVHRLEARKESHKSSYKEINLTLGKSETITIDAPTPVYGFLEISSTPMKADIYIDGKLMGQTPKVIYDVFVGTHELKLEKQSYTSLKKSIEIKEGETLSLNEKLKERNEQLAENRHFPVDVQSGDKGTINGHEYVDLGLPSGLKWATCNVGADSPEDYGDYFAWGEISPKSEYGLNSSVTYGKQFDNISGKTQYDAARANWGDSWRMPTNAEFKELKEKCSWTWTTRNNINGYLVIGPNGNSIFLPAAGYFYNQKLYAEGKSGNFWSSISDSYSYDKRAYDFVFDNLNYELDYDHRYYGQTVRPVLK